MPAYVFKNSKTKATWVVDIPDHQVDDFAANWSAQGWSLDKKADANAAAVEVAAQAAPTAPVEK